MTRITNGFTAPPADTTRPTLRGRFGMTSSTHWLATGAAQSVLENGGNAYDAAVAAGFVLHVVEPHLNGPGGDLTAIVAGPGQPEPRVLMGQGPAPAAATIEHYRAEGLDMVPGAGALAAAVPGAVDAWLLLLAERGTWELADVLAYAIDYARHGHPLGERVAATIAAVRRLFIEHWPDSARQWLIDGQAPAAGTTVRNAAYADTLERLIGAGDGLPTRRGRIEAARGAWGTGFVAEAIDRAARHVHRHSSGTDHAGVIAASDLAAFRASWEPAVTARFRGTTVAKTGPWGQGPVLLQALAVLDGLPDKDLDPSTTRGAHAIIETLKLCLADRDGWYGDPEDPGAVPLDTLLSAEYAARRRRLIGPRAADGYRPGTVDGIAPFASPLLIAADRAGSTDRAGRTDCADRADGPGADGEPTVGDTGLTRGDTCHVDVVDRWGNAIAATPSGGWLQSSPHIAELGFALGTRLQMTWLDAAAPSALRPGGRPRTTLSPTLLLREGRPIAALGSPGGDQQDQWQLLYLLRTLVGGYSPQQAIDAPALHTTAFPGSFWPRTWQPAGAVVENRLGKDVIDGLAARGHRITRAGDWSLGRLCVAGHDEEGWMYAAANPRGMTGYAAGR